MAARLFGIRQPMTAWRRPVLNSSDATWNTAWRVVRSPMPISTTPLPIGMTSPPSTVAAPCDCVAVAPPDLEVSALEARMELVDRALEQRLRLARRPEHRVAGDAVVDPARGVALEQRVRNRRDDEVGAAERLGQHLASLPTVGRSRIAMPPIRYSASLAARQLLEPRRARQARGRARRRWA